MSRPFPSPLQGVLFDMDGTLIDSEHLHFQSTNDVLSAFRCKLQREEFNRYIGWAEREFWDSLKERFGIRAAAAELAKARTARLEQLLETPLTPLAGVPELLRFLGERGIPNAVASSSPRRQIELSLKSAGLLEGVGGYVSGHDDVARGKPHPDVYLEAARLLGVPPKRCLAIEDSSTGLSAALAAGAWTAAIPCASHPDPDLGRADRRFASAAELLRFLQARTG